MTTGRFLSSPSAFLAALTLGILLFGIGLTSPIWFLIGGLGPLEAMHAGLPIMIGAFIGLVVTILAGMTVNRLRGAPDYVPEVADDAATEKAALRHHRIVHALVILMFVVPFLTIILGILLRHVIDADAG